MASTREVTVEMEKNEGLEDLSSWLWGGEGVKRGQG